MLVGHFLIIDYLFWAPESGPAGRRKEVWKARTSKIDSFLFSLLLLFFLTKVLSTVPFSFLFFSDVAGEALRSTEKTRRSKNLK